jgi:urease accessory protein
MQRITGIRHMGRRSRQRIVLTGKKGGESLSDLLVNDKIDLAPYAGASLEVLQHGKKMREERAYVFARLRRGQDVDKIASYIERKGDLVA